MKRGEPIPRQQINFFMNQGGLGDEIARLPAIKYALEQYPYIDLTVVCADYFLPILNHFFGANERCKIYGFSQFKGELTKRPYLQTLTEFHTPFHIHLVDHAFRNLVDMDVEIEHKNYLQFDLSSTDVTGFKLPDKYVVLTTGYTAIVRKLPDTTINELADYIKSKGYEPVFLGRRVTDRGISDGLQRFNADKIQGYFSDGIDFSKGTDLTERTSLLEAAKIMDGSRAVIGLDNGLLHLAGGTSATVVAAYTNVLPHHRLPIRNNVLGFNCHVVTPDPAVCCACQSTSNYLPEHDYRECIYQDTLCNEQLTSEKFIKILEGLL